MQHSLAETERLCLYSLIGRLKPSLPLAMVPWSLVKQLQSKHSILQSNLRIFWCLWGICVVAGIVRAALFGVMCELQESWPMSYIVSIGLFSFLAEEVGICVNVENLA